MNFVHYDMQEFILDSLKLLHANVLCWELPRTTLTQSSSNPAKEASIRACAWPAQHPPHEAMLSIVPRALHCCGVGLKLLSSLSTNETLLRKYGVVL